MATLRTAVNATLFCIIAMCVFQKHASAQAAIDMWTELAEKQGLFSPHTDTCDSSTESYITIGNGSLGFCMENSLRTAATWTNAKQTCASVGKRLPEPAEYKYACDNAGSYSLSNMTGGWEWASNVPSQAFFSTSDFGTFAPIVGYTNCGSGAFGEIMSWTGSSAASVGYRCVR
jgi:hypothetical protein